MTPRRGRVYLVGAGPGDPGLMTVRGRELIARADVILHDRLIPHQALDGARPDARVIDVGKRGGGEQVPQQETMALLLEHAGAGATVVRLKGGDPFVFGRGGEEALALREAGVAFEVVPGVTSGVAAPAYAGIPVTYRDRASAVALITGHEDPAKPETALDWTALAGFPGTLVFYMGVAQLGLIAERLTASGRGPDELVAIIERGTLPGQRVVTGTLATIADRAGEAAISPPSVTVVGPVAALSDELAWFGRGPLAGATVAVTRARAQASALGVRLGELGARVIEAPTIAAVALPAQVPDLGAYDLLCLTSPVGVHHLFSRLEADGRDARALAGVAVAAIGPGTARALGEHGVRADVVAERFVAEGLVEALADRPVGRALIARARRARDVLPEALRAGGAVVDVVDLYETVAEPLGERELASARAADYVTFTSASTVRFFLEAAGGEAGLSSATRIVSIGPVTSQVLREAGLEAHVEAERHDVEGLVEALVADARRRSPGSTG